MLHLSRRHRARTAVAADQVRVRIAWAEPASAAPAVVPGDGHDERLRLVEVGVQRPHVAIVLQRELKPGVHVPEPGAILVVLHVPLPLESLGPRAAFGAETHRIAGGAGLERDLQPDVAEVGRRPAPDCDMNSMVPSNSISACTFRSRGRRGCAPPRAATLGPLREGSRHRGPTTPRAHPSPRRRARRAREQLAWGVGEAGHLDGEATADESGEPVGAEDHLAPEDVYRVAVRLDGRVGRTMLSSSPSRESSQRRRVSRYGSSSPAFRIVSRETVSIKRIGVAARPAA